MIASPRCEKCSSSRRISLVARCASHPLIFRIGAVVFHEPDHAEVAIGHGVAARARGHAVVHQLVDVPHAPKVLARCARGEGPRPAAPGGARDVVVDVAHEPPGRIVIEVVHPRRVGVDIRHRIRERRRTLVQPVVRVAGTEVIQSADNTVTSSGAPSFDSGPGACCLIICQAPDFPASVRTAV